MHSTARQDALVSDVVGTSIGIGGLAMCITLVFLGMRSVMDIGGACADGGPYVSAQGCPAGATVALFIGMFGLFLFGGIAMWFGVRIGGIWAAAPLLAWSGLFLSLGWNFLDYGVINTPEGVGVVWGWAFCGIVFMLMGGLPLVIGLAAFGEGPLRRQLAVSAASSAGAGSPFGTDDRREAALGAIDADLSALLADAASTTPADPAARGNAFPETTQALLDRLERLAGLRDRGRLAPDEYEAAKDLIVRELESRS